MNKLSATNFEDVCNKKELFKVVDDQFIDIPVIVETGQQMIDQTKGNIQTIKDKFNLWKNIVKDEQRLLQPTWHEVVTFVDRPPHNLFSGDAQHDLGSILLTEPLQTEESELEFKKVKK